MQGVELHNKLKTIFISNKELSFTVLAERMGLTSPQALYSKLKAKSVDYSLIKEVADALQIDVLTLTGEMPMKILEEPTPTYMKRDKSQPKDYKDQLIYSQQEQIRLHQKVEQLQDKLLAVYEQKKE